MYATLERRDMAFPIGEGEVPWGMKGILGSHWGSRGALNRCHQMRFAPVFLLLANFRTVKYDFDLYKGFFMENLTQIRQILKNYFFKFP